MDTFTESIFQNIFLEMSVLRHDMSFGRERRNGLGEMGDNFTVPFYFFLKQELK
jgi:hypothetical protein